MMEIHDDIYVDPDTVEVDSVITIGGIQSNHARATAIADSGSTPQRKLKLLETYKSLKINIKDILVNNNVEAGRKINEIVNYVHLLRMLTTHLLKLLILKQKFQGKKIKIKNYINESFIIVLMETIASNKNAECLVGLEKSQNYYKNYTVLIFMMLMIHHYLMMI